ncbi:MAG: phospholipase D-like domain-containing protein [Eubacteriales bacterium]|nr:phospholipase D-like domain-containing protein [Eubacteriales bacterium]
MQIHFPSKKEIFSIPNIMGYFRILLLPFIASGILNGLHSMTIILLVISALTDFFDGRVARRFNMVTNLGKALDPVADKLTLCILFLCLAVKNDYAHVIVIVMIFKEFYMLLMEMIVKKSSGSTTGGAKWYGKGCTAALFISLGIFLIFPHIGAMLSNIITLFVVYIMIFTMLMYGFLFRSILKNEPSVNIKHRKNKPDKKFNPVLRSFFYTLLLILFYIVSGAALPFLNHPAVSMEYDEAFNINDYRYTDVTSDLNSTYDETSPQTSCNTDRVRLIATNDEALNERIRLIDMAKDSIILSTFDFRADESGKDVIAALCDAADRNVDIKILVDGFSSILNMDGKKEFYELASKPCVELKIYNPVNILKPWNLMGRMHDKYLIVDDYGYMLGGRNTFDLFLGSYYADYKNLDLEVFVWNEGNNASSSLNQVKAYFDKIWELSYCEPYNYPASFPDSNISKNTCADLTQRLTDFRLNKSDILNRADSIENTLRAGKIKLLSNPIHRGNKEPYIYSRLYRLMDSASERVYLHTPYIICSKDMYKGLTAIGHKNIETKLLLNAPETGANPFGCSDYVSEKTNVLATGFSIYEYMGNYSYHTKAVLIDHDLSIIGSYNTDMRSTYLDTELMLSIESKELNAALENVMSEAESQCRYRISETDYTVPVSVTDAAFNKKDRIMNKLIVFITRPFRFLL